MNPWVIGLLMSTLGLGIHLAPPLNSMLSGPNEKWNPGGIVASQEYIAYNIEVHRSVEPAFIKRPLTTWCLDALISVGLSPAWSFILFGFVLFFIAGVLVYHAALVAGLEHREALLAQVAFHALPTVVFAFFAPIYSYDEPLQYVALLLSFLAFQRKRFPWFILWFCVAMLARETSALLIPSLLWLNHASSPNDRARSTGASGWGRLAGMIAIGSPLLIYVLFLAFYLPHSGIVESSRSDLGGRLSFFDSNFKDGDMAGESLSYCYLALGLPLFLLGRYAISSECLPQYQRLIRAVLIALVVNTAAVFVAAKAREARLFALPLLLVLPLLGRVWLVELRRHGGFVRMLGFFKRWDYALVFLLSGGLLMLVSDHVFSLSDGVPSENLFHEYFMVQSLFIVCCLLSDFYQRAAGRRKPRVLATEIEV